MVLQVNELASTSSASAWVMLACNGSDGSCSGYAQDGYVKYGSSLSGVPHVMTYFAEWTCTSCTNGYSDWYGNSAASVSKVGAGYPLFNAHSIQSSGEVHDSTDKMMINN